MQILQLRFALASLALAALAAAVHAQAPVSSTLDLGAYAAASFSGNAPATGLVSLSQGTTLNSLTGTLSKTDTLPTGGGSLNARTSGTATWTSAAAGSFNLTTGFTFSGASGKADLNYFQTGGKDVWTYAFTATSAGTFSMAYDVEQTGDTFGLGGININWSGTGGGLSLSTLTAPQIGTFTRALLAGQQYTVGVQNYSNLSTILTTVNGNLSAALNWRIQAVPEPAPFAALGLGAVALLRRRKAASK